MSDKYTLDDNGQPVPCPDLMTWARWYERSERRVAFNEIDGVEVSTVFLSIDHSFGNGDPVLFETMVFGGPLDQEQERYATRQAALAGHAAMVRRVRAAYA